MIDLNSYNNLLENEGLLQKIISFLDNENYSSNSIKVSKTLIKIKFNSLCNFTNQEFSNILDAFEAFFNNPNGNAENLVNTLLENNIDPLAISTENACIESTPNQNTYFGTSWSGLTVNKIWEIVGSVKANFLNLYPNKSEIIENFFTCRVIGLAFEEASLGSLGIPKNNENIGGCIPDGQTFMPLIGGEGSGSLHLQRNIIEVKARLGSTFDYSENSSQLNCYLNKLSTETFIGSTTVQHGLYLILPDGVNLGPVTTNKANDLNIPILLSHVELGNNDVNKFRVKDLEFVNVSHLNRSGHLFSYLPDSFFAWARKRAMKDLLFYQKVLIDFNKYANSFEQSHLVGNSTEGCPPSTEGD